ncbi:peptide deformylase [Falsibacillus albus]|uniref:Peptide deformylase n=1 Tax=Falsibacillus albus TaxID=2478915 RepID=A0A3L7K511_9BACI|nr:peptide deformylase [Falsibacillus albus]RLQ95792.1 peptide deformylase [Falsibacillus albus]
MAVLQIVEHPAAVLEAKCRKVNEYDEKLHQLLDDMYETMVEADGVGLAAPQIGIDQQIAIVEIDEESGTIEMVNPEILETKGEQLGIEGCLSFPNLYGEVSRPYYVRIKAFDRNGQAYLLEAEDFLARAIQHEIDHLHGILFTSKVNKYIDEAELERYEEV